VIGAPPNPIVRWLEGRMLELPADDRARLEAIQLEETRPAITGVTLAGAALLLVLCLLELAGLAPGIGYPPWLTLVGACGLALAALALDRMRAWAGRVALLCLYLAVLGALLSMPLPGTIPQLAFRTGLFNLVPIAILAVAVRPAGTMALVVVFLALAAARLALYGEPASGPALYWVFNLASILLGLMLRRYRSDFAVQTYRARRELMRQATVDTLTGLYNRTGWNRQVPAFLLRAVEDGRSVAVVFFDIDHFKQVNDTHGHAAGDAILRLLGNTLRRCEDDSCVTARMGGEEFVVVLAARRAADAVAFAERVRARFRSAAAKYACTVSAGVAVRGPGEELGEAMKRADQALYLAKAGGRDRVSVAPGPDRG
jgi:diguanylate cyclase (GGDEF)-like protein